MGNQTVLYSICYNDDGNLYTVLHHIQCFVLLLYIIVRTDFYFLIFIFSDIKVMNERLWFLIFLGGYSVRHIVLSLIHVYDKVFSMS